MVELLFYIIEKIGSRVFCHLTIWSCIHLKHNWHYQPLGLVPENKVQHSTHWISTSFSVPKKRVILGYTQFSDNPKDHSSVNHTPKGTHVLPDKSVRQPDVQSWTSIFHHQHFHSLNFPQGQQDQHGLFGFDLLPLYYILYMYMYISI